jgi:hypothetical protein
MESIRKNKEILDGEQGDTTEGGYEKARFLWRVTGPFLFGITCYAATKFYCSGGTETV